MTSAQLAVIAAAGVWMVGLRWRAPFSVKAHRGRLDFWWATSAFFLGIYGTVSALLGLGSGGGDIGAALRISPMLALGLLLAISNTVRGGRIGGVGLLLLALFAVILVQTLANPALMGFLSFVAFLPAVIAPKDGYSLPSLQSGARLGIFISLGALGVSAAISSQTLLGMCRSDKCSIWGVALGPLGLGNALGMALAAGFVVSLVLARGWTNVLLILSGSYILVDLTSSRSALNGWLVGVAISIGFLLSSKYKNRFWIGTSAILVSVVVAVFPFWGWRADAFTGRGALWTYAQELFRERPWFGYGSSFWVRGDATTELERNYSTHSLVPELLVTAGAVGLVLFAIALVVAARSRGDRVTSTFVLAMIALTVSLSVTEVFSLPGRTYLFVGLCVFALVASQAASGDRSSTVAGDYRARGGRRGQQVHRERSDSEAERA